MRKYIFLAGFIMVCLLIMNIKPSYGLEVLNEEDVHVNSHEFLEYVSNNNLQNIKRLCVSQFCETLRGSSLEKSFALFRDIEIYYCIENDNEPQNLFAHIQSSLIDYLDELLENYPNPEDLLNAYEPAIITPEKIKLMDKNPDNYIDLEESVAKFYHIKDKYMKKYRT